MEKLPARALLSLALSLYVAAAAGQDAPAETAPQAAPPAESEAAAAEALAWADVPELPEMEVKGKGEDRYAVRSSISATKTDTPLLDVPQSITVVPREQILDQSMQSLGDVLLYVPGVGVAQGEGNRETPIFRGNSSTSDFFVDGLRDDTQYYRDLYNIERVEVLKGPNAMIFGRGGVGGVLNRVTRQADWTPVRELTVQAGSYENLRTTADFGEGLTDWLAWRVTGLWEDTNSYRDGVGIRRSGVNPTAALRLGNATRLRLGAEYFTDDRIADRGHPSFNGRPFAADESVFFGNPALSPTGTEVMAGTMFLDHDFGGGLTLRNATRFADYDKFYQNVFAGGPVALDAGDARLEVPLSAYRNATDRRNVFNQTDLVWEVATGSVEHVLLGGFEFGRQDTVNRRLTGFFADDSDGDTDGDADPDSTFNVPVSNPNVSVPVAFTGQASDADNDGVADVAAVYLQDQVTLLEQLELVAGVRYDHFEVDFNDRRAGGGNFQSTDDLVSPRGGLIYKPLENTSLYLAYTKSYLPRAGEQLSSLSASNASLEPEEFDNYEVGAKWDVQPGLALTAAVYQLDRSNVAVADPLNPGQFLLVDGQETRGVELGVTGQITPAWHVAGGYAYQDAVLTATTGATATAGSAVGQVPYHTASLWNRYDFTDWVGAGVGVYGRSDMYTSTSNAVTLDGYVRVDGALFFRLNRHLRAQLNVENLLDEEYHPNAHNDNNITPGGPTAARVTLVGSF